MFRFLFRRPRTVRVPVDNANVDLQTVRVTQQSRSRPAVTQFLLVGAATILTIEGLKYLDPLGQNRKRDALQEKLEDAKKVGSQANNKTQYGKHWDDQHARMNSPDSAKLNSSYEESEGVRLTIPFWIRKGSPMPYHPNDPVFSEYARLQGDQKRMEKLKKQLAEGVIEIVKTSGRHKLELQLIGFNGKVKGNLEFAPPLFAPPILQVPCLWLSWSSVDYGWRGLPPDTGARVERVFRPLVLLEATYAASLIFFHTTYAITKAKVSKVLGTSDGTDSKHHIAIPQLPPVPKSEGSATGSTQDVIKSTKPIFPFLPDMSDGRSTRKMHQDVVSAMPYSLAIQQAAAAFNHVKTVRQKLASSQNVRGACQIRGTLQFVGNRGKLNVEVTAWYLPSEELFLGATVIQEAYVLANYNAWQKEHEDIQRKQKEKREQRLKILEEQKDAQKKMLEAFKDTRGAAHAEGAVSPERSDKTGAALDASKGNKTSQPASSESSDETNK